ncbi:MAG: inositol monophosphatase [Gemmatimonadaceae bacterium]|jgi:myo-inositol-1(or 4)-monophosphatase|nr:inositol monophosphatase [Gemmatimonadaceae bacterium]
MPTSPSDARHLRDIALAAARAGASVIAERARDRASLTWEEKSPADFVSVVDRAAEAALAEVIATQLPDATLLAEEGTPDASITRGITVVADPLDGTTNFLHGFPWYATSVGVLVDGVLSAGAIVNAATGETFVAHAGGGAHRVAADHTTSPIHVSSIREPLRALIGTGFPFRHAHHLPRYQAQFAAVATRTAGMRRAGSAALDLCDVACGRFEGFWEIELAPWDVAAGVLLVREAGGLVTDWDGVDVPVQHGPIIAGNPHLHSWLLDALAGRLG